ncbi:nitroreductase family protein [Acidaminococcus timonensis]|uniref:nitroreductase family protein n=1 Tax=Acidaminococcus timonensis TaxID=1871002 RepID=UPI0025D1DC57|nr:nitroreductase family protein [Acidaminococcus timonensis]
MENLFHRTSVRKYLDKPVEKEKILQILRAAMAAPSACNQQPWRFTVVTDRALITALAATSPYATFAAEAPILLVISYRKDCQLPEFAPVDTSAALENLWIETDALGLGGVWMGVYPRQERMDKVAETAGLPQEEEAFALYALGYPAGEIKPHDRFHEEWIRWK